jgi:hypothetical protein
MYNPNIDIKKWFYTNLTSATGLGVYDGIAPITAGNEYLILTDRTSSQVQGKNGYTNTLVFMIDIVTKNANFGFKRAETISNLILNAINSDTHITLPTGWNASSLSVAGIRNLSALNPLDNVFRTLITYNLTITQN